MADELAGGLGPASTETYITDSFVLSECTMTIKSGRVIDLQAVIQEIVFFEDMFSPNITGSILIQDMAGGHEKFILTGGEKLTIRVMRGDRSETIITRADLVVYEISKMKVDNQNSLTYERSDNVPRTLRGAVTSSFHTKKIPFMFSFPHAIAAFLVLNAGPLTAFVEHPTSHLNAISISCI